MKSEFKYSAHFAILISSFIFGLNLPITKTLLQENWITPFGMTMVRMLGAALAFWLTSLFVPKEKVAPKDLWILFLCSILGVNANQGFFVIGLANTSPIDSGLIVTITPILVMLLAAAVLKEPITFKKVIGVMVGGLGVLLIVLSGIHSETRMASWWGNALCIASCTVYACYLVIIRPLAQRYNTITIMKWMFLFAVVMSLPFFGKELISARVFTSDTNFGAVWRLIYVVFGATFVSYLLVPVALKNLRPTTVGMYNYLQPIVATVTTIALGLDTMRWEIPVAAALVFVGVYLVVKSKSRQDVLEEQRTVGNNDG